uniref:E3 ubiquitin protein ligase n=1 Tax=Auxenochlorella protothecoides TaxID=3075 RepID=A0A1D1ZRY0_AUXPR
MGVQPSEDALGRLLDKNRKLYGQVEAQRGIIDRLESRIFKLQEDEEVQQETLLHVNRAWDELNASIDFLRYRAGAAPEPSADNHAAAQLPSTDTLLLACSPFLARLASTCLNSDALDSAELEEGEPEELEVALCARSAATSAAAAGLLDAIEALRAGGVPGKRAEPDAAAEPASISEQIAATRPFDPAVEPQALLTLVKAENRRLRSVALASAARVKKLQTSLADREAEFHVAQRRIAQLKARSQGEEPPSAGSSSKEATPEPPVAAADSQALTELQGKVAELEREVEQGRADLRQAQRDARALRDSLQLERDAAERARYFDSQRLARLDAEFKGLEDAMHHAHAERDHVLRCLHDAEFQLDGAASVHRRLASAEAQIAALDARLASASAARAEAELALAAERGRVAGQPTVAHLQELLGTYKRDVASHRARIVQQKQRLDELQAAKDAADAGLARLEAAHAAEMEAVRKQHGDQERAWKEREQDLTLFMQLVRDYDAGPDQALCGEHARSAALRSDLGRATAELAAARGADPAGGGAGAGEPAAPPSPLQRQLAACERQVAALREETEAYLAELESVGAAYEEAQAAAARLAEESAARDEERTRLLGDVTRARLEREAVLDSARAAEEGAAAAREAAAAAAARAAEVEARCARCADDLAATRGELSAAVLRGAAAERAAREREADAAALRAEGEGLRGALGALGAERDAALEARAELEARVSAAEASLAAAAAAGPSSTAGGGGAAGQVGMSTPDALAALTAEAAALRKMVNCSVCHQRQKDVIITKCYHMFCAQCIKRNLESRHRKCPGCGTAFGQGDVAHFFFT